MLDVVASTEMVMENDVAATPSMEPPTVVSRARLPVALRESTNHGPPDPLSTERSRRRSTSASPTAAAPMTAGTNQNDSRSRRRRALHMGRL